LVLSLLFAGCSTAPVPRDVTLESWYRQSVQDLASMNRQAEDFFRAGRGDDAAAVIQKAQPVMK
jgi:hypothetical protein